MPWQVTKCEFTTSTGRLDIWLDFKSIDMGDHWLAVNSGIDDLTVSGLAMDPGNSSVLYACGPNGVYKTLVGGEVNDVR